MSADNGIYILKTKEGQHRVIHTQAIDNLYYSFLPTFDHGKLISSRLLEYYGRCKYTYEKDLAMYIAGKVFDELDICEYGIQFINSDKTWKQIIKDGVEYARKELEYVNNDYHNKQLQGILIRDW